MPDSLASVKHVIVLMQENRSFDQYFGLLPGVRGFFDPNAIPGVFAQRKSGGGRVVNPFRMDTATTSAETAPDNNHLWSPQHAAWNNGKLDSWLDVQVVTAMGYFGGLYRAGSSIAASDIPYQFALAQTFTVADAYFCSVLGPTLPNRLFLMSGTIGSGNGDGGPVTDNPGTPGGGVPPYTWHSYPEQLFKAGVSWAIYEEAPGDTPGWDMNVASMFSSWPTISAGAYRSGPGQFENDLATGRLPAVSWIIPPYSKSEHPPHPPADGANYVAGKIAALLDPNNIDPMTNAPYWDSTVFIVVYDENDGAFDHMVPPAAPPGTADEWVMSGPNTGVIGPGFRVPCTIVSPWSVGGRVFSTPCDHTSIIRFIGDVAVQAYGADPLLVGPINVSSYRLQVLGNLADALDFSIHVSASSVPALPPAPPYPTNAPSRPAPKPVSPQVWPPWQLLLGVPGAPCAASQQFGVDQTDVFTIDQNGVLNVMWFGAPATEDLLAGDRGGWQGPLPIQQALPDRRIFSPGAPLAVSQRGADQTDVFAVDVDGALRVAWVVGRGTWNSAERIPLPAGSSPNLPPSASLAAISQVGSASQTDAFAIDEEGVLNVFWGKVGGIGTWEWTTIPSGRVKFPPGAPIAASRQFELPQTDVFVVDTEGNLQVFWVVGDGVWQGPARIGNLGNYFPTSFLTASRQFGFEQTDVFLVDRDGHLNVVWVVGAGTWQWARLGNGTVFQRGTSVAASQQFGRQQTDVFLVDGAGNLVVLWTTSSGWSEPAIIGAGLPPNQRVFVAASRQFGDQQTDVFAVDSSGNLNVAWTSPDGWQGPVPIEST